MKVKAEIIAEGDTEKLYKIFKPEEGKQKRAEYQIKKGDGCLIFEVEAEDSTAMRAILNSITKLLTIYEKMEQIK